MTVRWGFLGAGNIATTALAPAVHAATGAELRAVAARSRDRANSLEPTGHAYDAYDAIINDPEIDAVYVSLTNEVHVAWVLAVLAAGKHVLCEKPLGLDAAEVERMAAAAREHDRMLVEAFWYRWHPRIRRAEELVRSGAVGQVCDVEASFTSSATFEGNFRLDPARGGGALYDLGCYAISAALWAYAWQRPDHVRARSTVGVTNVDMMTTATLSFGAGQARIRSAFADLDAQTLKITGDVGSLELEIVPFTARGGDATDLVVRAGGDEQRLRFEPADAYKLMVEEFDAVAEGRGGWVMPLDQSTAIARVMDAVRHAGHAGQGGPDGPNGQDNQVDGGGVPPIEGGLPPRR